MIEFFPKAKDEKLEPGKVCRDQVFYTHVLFPRSLSPARFRNFLPRRNLLQANDDDGGGGSDVSLGEEGNELTHTQQTHWNPLSLQKLQQNAGKFVQTAAA